jgi:hypothetical protein
MGKKTKITKQELLELFGERMPLEATSMAWDPPGNMTLVEQRAKLREMARAWRKSQRDRTYIPRVA